MNSDIPKETTNLESSEMLEKKQKKPFMKKLLKLVAFVFIVLGLLAVIGLFSDDNKKEISSLYSENQQRVIKNFGKPQTFKFAQQDDSRLEYWRYIYLDEIFVFQDGQFVSTQHYKFDVEDNEAIYFDLEPADFYNAYIIDDVTEIMKDGFTLEADIDDGILGENYKFYSYEKLLNVTTQDGFIEVIDTYAVKSLEEMSQTSDSNSEEEVGKAYVGAFDLDNSSFSYYLNDAAYRYIKQRPLITDDGEKATYIYGYCYTLDEGESFSDTPQDPYACSDNESLLWTIEIYTHSAYASMEDMEKTYYEEIASNDEYVYLVSHANGDFPNDLPSWGNTLVEIKSTFSVPIAKKYADILDAE